MRRLLLACLMSATSCAYAQSCGNAPVQLQILGSGTGNLAGARAAPSALLWLDGRARVLIDTGPGVALRLVQTGADISDIDAILLTHLRAERSTDLPAVLQLRATPPRTRELPLYGPTGNRGMPSTVTLVRTLFDSTRGVWRHLGDLLSPLTRASYKLEPHDLRPTPAKLGSKRDQDNETLSVFINGRVRINAVLRYAGLTPMVIWHIQAAGKNLVFTGDPGIADDALKHLSPDVDILVTSFAIDTPEPTTTSARLAQTLKAKQLVLLAASGREEDPIALARRHYAGTVAVASDLECLAP